MESIPLNDLIRAGQLDKARERLNLHPEEADSTDSCGVSMLHQCLNKRHWDAAMLLLSFGADPCANLPAYGQHSNLNAVVFDAYAPCELLDAFVQNGMDPELFCLPDHHGNVPLLHPIRERSPGQNRARAAEPCAPRRPRPHEQLHARSPERRARAPRKARLHLFGPP